MTQSLFPSNHPKIFIIFYCGRQPNAVMNHLHFCMMATSVVWIYVSRVEKTPSRRHEINDYKHDGYEDLFPQRPIKKGLTTTNSRKPLSFLVGTERFELSTSTVSG